MQEGQRNGEPLPKVFMNDFEISLGVEEARELLHAAGLRRTACRIAVLQVMTAASAPLSHAEACESLVSQGFDKSTIYRSLVEFADAGLAARLDLGDHVWRFELLEQNQTQPEHAHFMCVDCGKVECVTDMKVRLVAAPKTTASRSVTEVLLKGTCGECG